jgi:acyl-CoA thioesterase-1
MFRLTLLILMFISSLPVFAGNKTLLILGDSLSASYGISLQQGWVALLEQRLAETGYDYTVVNASISGETTAGAKVRMNDLLESVKPAITVVELGGNDGLRGLSPEEMLANLADVITALRQAGSEVLLIPIHLPPNYGKVYNDKIRSSYDQIAEQDGVYLGRFILEGIGDNPDLMQSDGIHPVAEAQTVMLENVWPDLEPLLEK